MSDTILTRTFSITFESVSNCQKFVTLRSYNQHTCGHGTVYTTMELDFFSFFEIAAFIIIVTY